ncbi:MAG: hypothetical protein K940chlam3_01549, partial [Chlamydiae bacterium]|nr:hypothetical protein [Chlamydiota bacterium]
MDHVTNMTTIKKTKLCWNCEGVVDRSSENCVYCGVYLHPEKEETDGFDSDVSRSPLYTPEDDQDIELQEHQPHYQTEDEKILNEEIHGDDIKVTVSEDIRGVILPLLFLLAGSVFLLFGLILYFFSNDGVFVLKWNANYWFIYLLFSFPFLYIG